jgi:hypothetical protein
MISAFDLVISAFQDVSVSAFDLVISAFPISALSGYFSLSARSRNLALSADPILGASLAVTNRKNPNCVIPDQIGCVIGKDLQVYATVTLRSQTRQFRVMRDPVDQPAGFFFQAEAQARFDLFVVGNGFIEFLLRLLKDLELHDG